MGNELEQRKADHLALCATDAVRFKSQSNLLECVRLIHSSVPELSADEIDTSVRLFGKVLRAPILIAAMTGGTDEAEKINRTLAAFAEARGYAFGLGSQRAMLKNANVSSSFQVRSVAPTTCILGNLGLTQATEEATESVAALARSVEADAFCIHMNPAMEIVQSEGDRDFRGGLATFGRLCRDLSIPVIAKETGCGVSAQTAQKLYAAGVRHIDVSGAGGTSWVGVEALRAKTKAGAALGEAFWDWGIPTAASIAYVREQRFDTVIATGGIASGLDVARAIALGASLCGIARPALVAAKESRLVEYFDGVEAELRAAMLLTGSRTVTDLGSASRILTGSLRDWL